MIFACTMRVTQFAATLLILASCAEAVPPITDAPQLRPIFYVMRHLHTAGGVDPDLTEEGRRHAEALPEWLARRLAGGQLSAIYISATKRAQQTAAPLAARLGITPTIYDASNTPALIAAIRAESGAVLIVGHSNTVPDIIELLGGRRPGEIGHDDFGEIWHLAGPDPIVVKSQLHID